MKIPLWLVVTSTIVIFTILVIPSLLLILTFIATWMKLQNEPTYEITEKVTKKVVEKTLCPHCGFVHVPYS